MHYKTKSKLKAATKLYIIEPEDGLAVEVKVQLPNFEYIEFELNQPFPTKVVYKNLAHGGFNYNPDIDTPITHYPKKRVLIILKNSIGYRNNNEDTIDKLIELINEMAHYI